MSALENLLAEVRVEAEAAVRTEYENTVVSLRSIVKGLEDDLRIANGEWDKWRDAYNKLVKEHDDLVDRVAAAIGRR